MMTRKKEKEKSVENNRRGKKKKRISSIICGHEPTSVIKFVLNDTLWAVFIFLLVYVLLNMTCIYSPLWAVAI